MKTNYFLKLLATLLLGLFVTNVTAKQITVSEPATDTDIVAALEQADPGDEIVIDGIIYFDASVTINKNVTFIGASGDSFFDGFDGQGLTKLFEINPDFAEDAKLVFRDISFANGYNGPDDGGIGRILTGNVEFYGCWFWANVSDHRGGAFYIPAPAENSVNVKFDHCTFEDNMAKNRGGAIFYAGDAVNSSFDFCKFLGNKTELDGESRGGCLYIEGGGTHNFYYCLLQGNTAGVVGEGGERGGGALVTGGRSAVTFESSAIVQNIAYGNHGGAFFVMGSPNITLINSVIAGNTTKAGAGSWFVASSDCDITLVNTIMTRNTGQNSGNGGGGFRIMNLNNRLNFFNSLILGNDTSADNLEGAVDLRANGDKPGIENTWVFKNSIVGLISGIDPSRVPAAVDKAGINPSLINMYNPLGLAAQPAWTDLDESGVDFSAQPLITADFGMPYYTLKDANAYAAKMGDPALLADYDRKTDMFGVERTTAGGAIFAGPVQSVTHDGIATDPTAIKQIAAPTVKDNIRVIGLIENGILAVDFGNIKGQTRGDLISLTGQTVENVFNRNVVGKGYYNVHVGSGIYLLRVVNGGNTYVQKVIVK